MAETQLAELKVILEQLNETTDLDRWQDLNNQFHNIIYQAANLPRFMNLIESLRNTMAPYLREYITTPENAAVARQDHIRIFEACAKHDPELVAEEIMRHLEGSKAYLQTVYKLG